MSRTIYSVVYLCFTLSIWAILGTCVIGPHNNSSTFFETIEDLPLMTGLTEDKDNSVVFDTPEGRIVEAIAFGRLNSEAVREFYRKTLPQFGWIQRGKTEYIREMEMLRFQIIPSAALDSTVSTTLNGGMTIRFNLEPFPRNKD